MFFSCKPLYKTLIRPSILFCSISRWAEKCTLKNYHCCMCLSHQRVTFCTEKNHQEHIRSLSPNIAPEGHVLHMLAWPTGTGGRDLPRERTSLESQQPPTLCLSNISDGLAEEDVASTDPHQLGFGSLSSVQALPADEA